MHNAAEWIRFKGVASNLSEVEEASVMELLDYVPVKKESDVPQLDRIREVQKFTDDSLTDERPTTDEDTRSSTSEEQEELQGNVRMVVEGEMCDHECTQAGDWDQAVSLLRNTVSQWLLKAEMAVETPAATEHSKPPAAPDTTATLPSIPETSEPPAVYVGGPEGPVAQKPLESSAAPEAEEQMGSPHVEDSDLPHKDDVIIEV